ncbi:MAG: hypothetical protein S0880_28695 [Actinomycetota bacterium]|nr:hypothetical protein [Actinomycetota bacterium]
MTRATVLPSRAAPAPRRRWAAAVALAAALVTASCGVSEDLADRLAETVPDSSEVPATPGATSEPSVPFGSGPATEPADALTDAGAELASGVDWDERPIYEVDARLEPDTGEVTGVVEAKVPVDGLDETGFRVLADDPALDADFRLGEVTVDGVVVEPVLSDTILRVPIDLPAERASIVIGFSYTAPEVAAPESSADPFAQLESLLGSEGLTPATVGLLGRHDGGLTLGHWFPLWLPPGADDDPTLDGFGDIGNFEASTFTVRLDVPDDVVVVTGGVRLDEAEAPFGEDGRVIVAEAGVGLRDLSVVVLDDATVPVDSVSATVGDTVVRVHGPADDPTALDEVAEEAATSLEVLNDAFGPYPWTELDVISVPLGASVGGMEWPGAVWIESQIFAGGIPGGVSLDDLGLEGAEGDLIGGLLDQLGLGAALDPDVLSTLRYWTVAHELGHEWWHAVVGNDSILSPAVDEPLAQVSACLVMRADRPDIAGKVCDAQTAETYRQMRLFGTPDTAAAQPADAFESSLQYGGVVYGKAPVMYFEMMDERSQEAVVAALATVVETHAFELIDTDRLLQLLGESLGDPAGVEARWQRWMTEAHGDEDLGVDGAGGLGLPGLPGLPGGEGGEDGLGGLGELLELLIDLFSGGG